MSMKKLATLTVTLFLASLAFGAGFGLYEMDAKTTAFGGNVLGRPINASTVYYNPAGLSALTGTWVNVSVDFLHPPIPYRVWGSGLREEGGTVDPGWFCFPNVFLSQQLPWDFTFGLGIYADYGLGSEYGDSWKLKYDSIETTFVGYTLNPAISYKITDDLSVGAGMRFTYVNFETEQIRDFNLGRYMPGYPNYGYSRLKLEADNRKQIGLGFNVGIQYRINDDVSVGAMYRSRIHTKLQGRAKWHGAIFAPEGGDHWNDLEDGLNLPAQCTFGLNWDRFIWENFHFGTSVSWIQWSCMDHIGFDVFNPIVKANTKQSIDLEWNDTFRYGVGFAYDITRNWEALLGYIYDLDPSNDSIGLAHTMLPPGDRHIITFGGAWHTEDRRWEIALTYGTIIMQHSCSQFAAEYGDAIYNLDTTASVTHLVTLGLSYHF